MALALEASPSAQARPVPHDIWEVTSVGKAYTTHGPWKACFKVTPQKQKHSVTCAVSRSVSNTVSGTVEVSWDVLNAHLGYNSTTTTTATGSDTYVIGPRQGGIIYYRLLYKTRDVGQTKYHFDMMGRRTVIGASTVLSHRYWTVTTKYVR